MTDPPRLSVGDSPPTASTGRRQAQGRLGLPSDEDAQALRGRLEAGLEALAAVAAEARMGSGASPAAKSPAVE